MLAGDLNASLERYARYYEHVHGDSQLTRHSSLWMNDVYQSVYDPSESGVIRRAFPYTRACTLRPPALSTSA
jgi:hypothetical protein